jgi:SAM-dependent methyltransferase
VERHQQPWQEDNRDVVQHFSGLVSANAPGPNAVGWGSRASQEKRFAVLADVGPLEGARILDVGCGTADLFGFLQRRGLHVDYTGYELTPAMAAAARQRYPEARVELVDLMAQPEPLQERFDYVMVSGMFYLRQREPMAYVEAMVRRMIALCTRGVAFNLLSARAALGEQDHPGEFYADPGRVLTLCLEITPWVVLRHDYMPHDFTTYLYKNEMMYAS